MPLFHAKLMLYMGELLNTNMYKMNTDYITAREAQTSVYNLQRYGQMNISTQVPRQRTNTDSK